MSAFIIAAIDVEDRPTFDRYVEMAAQVIGEAGIHVEAVLSDDPQLLDGDRKSTRLNSSHSGESRMPSSA